jgi:hypothetical protein
MGVGVGGTDVDVAVGGTDVGAAVGVTGVAVGSAGAPPHPVSNNNVSVNPNNRFKKILLLIFLLPYCSTRVGLRGPLLISIT